MGERTALFLTFLNGILNFSYLKKIVMQTHYSTYHAVELIKE